MKTMKCDICDSQFSAETFDDWFKQMQTHYMSYHADYMKQAKEEGMQWMSDMKAKFDAL